MANSTIISNRDSTLGLTGSRKADLSREQPGKDTLRKLRYTLVFCLTSAFLLFSVGCNQQQEAIDLYVDAVMHAERNENGLAVEKLDLVIQEDKRFSLAYFLLGEIYEKMKDYEYSAASYEKATELNPWSFQAYFSLGRVYQIMKEFAYAVRAYAKACELKPGHLQAHVNAAESYYQIEDYDNALTYGRQAEQIAPDTGEIQQLLGDIYGSKDDHEQAIASYKRALEIDSNNPDVMTSLAISYLKTNRNEPARELLTSALQIQPDNGHANKYLAYCHLRLGDLDKAMENYSRAVEINDKDWDAYRGLGVTYMLKGKKNDGTFDETFKAKAIQQWRISLDLNPDQPNHDKLIRLIRKYSKQDK